MHFHAQEQFRYYGVDSGTTESIPVLRSRFRYYWDDFAILRSRFRYYRIDSDIAKSITIWQSRSMGQKKARLDNLEGRTGVPRMFFGATKNREDNLETFFGTVSKHGKVIIEGSSGIMNFDMGPMGRK